MSKVLKKLHEVFKVHILRKGCERFTSPYCVDGNCPIALAEEYPWCSAPKNCDECGYRTGKCKDCVFIKTVHCPRTKGE